MNRYQHLMREAQNSLTLLDDEHRSLIRKFEAVQAETKRLRFAQYGTHDRRFQNFLTQCVRPKGNPYFDVISWKWVSIIDVPIGRARP